MRRNLTFTLLAVGVLLLTAVPNSAASQSLYDGRQMTSFIAQTAEGEEVDIPLASGQPSMLVYVEPGQNKSDELIDDLQRLLGETPSIQLHLFARSQPDEWNFEQPLLIDSDGSLYNAWRVRVFPVAILVDGEGVVQHVIHGYTRAEHERLAGELKVLAGVMTSDEFESSMEDQPLPDEDLPAEEFVRLGHKHWSQGFADRAREAWERALAVNPNLVEAHSALAGYFLSEGDVEYALQHLEQPLEQNPDSETWLLASRIYLAQGQLVDAEEAAENALDLNRRSHEAKLLLAEVYLVNGWSDEATEMASDVRVLYPDNAHALYLLGRAAEMEGKLEEAIGFYRQAFETKAGNW